MHCFGVGEAPIRSRRFRSIRSIWTWWMEEVVVVVVEHWQQGERKQRRRQQRCCCCRSFQWCSRCLKSKSNYFQPPFPWEWVSVCWRESRASLILERERARVFCGGSTGCAVVNPKWKMMYLYMRVWGLGVHFGTKFFIFLF